MSNLQILLYLCFIDTDVIGSMRFVVDIVFLWSILNNTAGLIGNQKTT